MSSCLERLSTSTRPFWKSSNAYRGRKGSPWAISYPSWLRKHWPTARGGNPRLESFDGRLEPWERASISPTRKHSTPHSTNVCGNGSLSYSIDVNLLLYGSDESSASYAAAHAFLESCAKRDEPLYLCYLTLLAYLRMSTHPRIYTNPLTPEEALRNVERLTGLPQVRLISEREGFFEVYRDLTKDVSVRANLVPDAHLASLLRQHGVSTLYTSNVDDFRKLGFPDVRNPLT